jgi:hypothetical protein
MKANGGEVLKTFLRPVGLRNSGRFMPERPDVFSNFAPSFNLI